jgi:hypothetical protein
VVAEGEQVRSDATKSKTAVVRKGDMTVKELKEKLSKLDDKLSVVVCWEDTEHGSEQHLFDIDSVEGITGTPRRRPNGKTGFTFGYEGSVTWAFISVDPA